MRQSKKLIHIQGEEQPELRLTSEIRKNGMMTESHLQESDSQIEEKLKDLAE